MTETLSKRSSKPFASYDQASSSWKTYPASNDGDSPEFSGRWPRWGFMRDGIAYELPRPAHLTEESASSSSRVLPTPVARDFKGRGMRGQLGTSLLPTPRTTDSNGAGKHGSGGLDLRTVVKLLPTPTTRNGEGNQVNNRGDLLLPGVAMKLLPTPVASMSSGQPDNGHQSGKSLMAMGSHGAFTVQPSDDKSASSGA